MTLILHTMENRDDNLDKLKEAVKKLYSETRAVRCPYFNEDVVFSPEGYRHLLYKGRDNEKRRDKRSRFMRLKLFRLAPELLCLTKTVQEYFSTSHFVPIKHHKKKEKVLRHVEYWGFVAILKERRIKVIVRQVHNGPKQFWSLIPNWRRGNKSHTPVIIHTGNPESD